MTTVDQPAATTPVEELPLAPLTWRSAWRTVDTVLSFAALIDDPGLRMRDTGEIFRLAVPRMPNPFKALITESFVDGFAGETVIITSPRLVRELYSLPPGQLNYEDWKKFLLFLLGAQSPFLVGGRDHVRIRRALAAELTPAQVEHYREGSVALLDDMIDALPLDTPVALHDFFTRFTQDVILRVVFGWDCRDLDELRDFLYEASKYYIKPGGRRLGGYMVASMFSLRRGYLPAAVSLRQDMPSRVFSPRGYRLRRRSDELIYRKIAEQRAHPNDSVASRLIGYGARENPAWTDKRLRDIIATLLIAGHDTSVVAYSWAAQYLLHNPGPRQKVIAEARAAVTDRYAQAANTEALRMVSPVTALVPFSNTQDIAVGGYRIRKDTFVFVPITAVHHNEELYPQPEQFRPERWLEGKPDRWGFVPFGVSAQPHRCPGSTFYLTEASIVTHRLFGRLDLEPCFPRVDHARYVMATLNRPVGQTEVIIRNRRPAADVPWYRPGRDEHMSPLKEALLPPSPEPGQPARCPHR
ncbi:cytochrome P450 [Actinocrispum wychmicini]|uniref:Cytochrome P450 n=1 Tax=Actinocrispum wychmicini TaxID=1213861 RepID=A0A4R2INH2_9PSEU|nr:cytochrome P450 [Actinocrispum wychmicini]TCO45906.1 cytochrome P450 [Actinocrispum wychmicini]